MLGTASTASSSAKARTLSYYADNASQYVDLTKRIDMSALYSRFLKYLARGGLILDAGSGSGRDTIAFRERGYQVEAFDASPELCELSTKLTGARTACIRFQDFASPPRYDGIWASASLLHVPLAELEDALGRLARALKPGAALYVSFKYGTGQRIADDGRLYSDMDEIAVRHLISAIPQLTLAEVWRSLGEGPHYGKDVWLNVIAIKSLVERESCSKG